MTELPKTALSCDYLIYGMMSIAALHLAHLLASGSTGKLPTFLHSVPEFRPWAISNSGVKCHHGELLLSLWVFPSPDGATFRIFSRPRVLPSQIDRKQRPVRLGHLAPGLPSYVKSG